MVHSKNLANGFFLTNAKAMTYHFMLVHGS